METAVSSGAESEDTVRILKDIRDEIRHARNELRDEIRGVRTERVDRPERGRRARAVLVVGIGLLVLSGGLLVSRGRGPRVEREPVARETPAPLANPMVAAPPSARPVAPAVSAAVVASPLAPTVVPPMAAESTPKRAPARHKVRPPTEAELEEPAKL